MNMVRKSLDMLLGRKPPAMQVGAICRKRGSRKVLLITSRDTGRWVIPKGWPMEGRSLAYAALQEAWEEAGVEGQVGLTEIGRFHYGKVQDNGFALPVQVVLYPVTVRKLAKKYPEDSERERQWFPPKKAASLVDEPELQEILRALA